MRAQPIESDLEALLLAQRLQVLVRLEAAARPEALLHRALDGAERVLDSPEARVPQAKL